MVCAAWNVPFSAMWYALLAYSVTGLAWIERPPDHGVRGERARVALCDPLWHYIP
jgi:hypothetical protein